MHFGFNNQFIKVMRTWPIFQKNQKIFCFVLMSGITNLHVKRIPDIKKVFLLQTLDRLGFTSEDKNLLTEKGFSRTIDRPT